MAATYYMILVAVIYVVTAEKVDTVKQSLDYVFSIGPETCGAGTTETLPLQFDVEAWNQYADPAIRTANLLSKIMYHGNGTLNSLNDDYFFFAVRNNVHGDSPIFGSGIAIVKGVLSRYDAFCPYAYKKNNTVRSHDIAINYNYLEEGAEWYNSLLVKEWSNVSIVTDRIMYRNGNILDNETTEVYPVAALDDGHWTRPYFDCGGGDVWMVTYSSPILYINHTGHINFKGLATTDIEMTNIDINQCDVDDDVTSGLDVFRGTHQCQKSTKCVHIKGRGFTTGSYICECLTGYYFPHKAPSSGAYLGSHIENHIRAYGTIRPGMFQCAACAPGCGTCIDASPCLYQHNEGLLLALLILTMVTVDGIIALMMFTYMNRNKYKAIKSASPSFLLLMCLGGILVCLQFIVEYLDSSVEVCLIRIWPQHLGFMLLYGSLVLKTWRISVIFTVGTRKRVYLPDKVLHQRLAVLTLLTTIMLGAWTASYPPVLNTIRLSGRLLYRTCYYGPWEYALIGGKSFEIVLLMYGVYLSFTVRKAPAHFNESKFITYAIYNAIILGMFLSFLPRFLLTAIGPDIASLFRFIQLQVFATITLLIIYVPKIFALRKETNEEGTEPRMDSVLARTVSTSIYNYRLSKSPSTDQSTQTELFCTGQ